ncbi:LacI family DNA-binding transcriptional regulator [Feifania hominis]|uniref:Substrate-binding domain-containing protein n=1 Tax=Feifania hominis TaxID=2763660 RepID=A0A926DE60_9FIRM|nr:substrate-binding domain-containing protein [Feifania hominis]MBC8536963.1 substrate-binding domain-containing protein [Feifania hominis]
MNLKDIANRAGVSSATVSMVLHNKGGVSRETRTRVEALLIENGYTIDSKSENGEKGGRNIRFLKYSLSSHLVDENPGFISAIIDSVERECRRLGYSLTMTAFRQKATGEIFESLRRERPDGVLLLGTEWTPADCRYLEGLDIPLVVLDNDLTNLPYNCVTGNPYSNIVTAVRYLSSRGHREIGYLLTTEPSCNCLESYRGYRDALTELDIPFDEQLVYEVSPTFMGAYHSMRDHLAAGRSVPSALLTNNDNLALGTMKALKEAGYRIPEDVALIGSDDTAAAAMAEPPLTSMHPDCRRIGIWAVRLLCDLIEYPDSPTTKMRLSSYLVERKSTEK